MFIGNPATHKGFSQILSIFSFTAFTKFSDALLLRT